MSGEFSSSGIEKLIETIVRDKGVARQVVVDAIVQGMLSAARKKYGTYREIEASYNKESGELELHEFKEVVDPKDFIDEEVEIKQDEAKTLDPDCKIGDYIGLKLDSSDLGRIAVQTAKQIVVQKVRDAEHEIIFQEFEKRKGEIASGIVRRVEHRTIVVDLGRTEAYLPQNEQIPGERYKQGDRVQGYILDVKQTNRGPQIIMSRAHENYMVKLFEIEVPEIHDGIVKILAAAREPGSRAKIAVLSKDSLVDPVGTCVGMKGSRVQNVVQELKGEKIDIVPFEEDIIRFACNAIKPSEVTKIFINETDKEMEVVVPDSQLSLAIGKKGQNVRLATQLIKWHIKIISESEIAKRQAEAIFNLSLLEGISDTMAQNIYQSRFNSIADLANASVEEVKIIPGYEDKEKALKLINDSKAFLQKYKDEGKEMPTLANTQKGKTKKDASPTKASDLPQKTNEASTTKVTPAPQEKSQTKKSKLEEGTLEEEQKPTSSPKDKDIILEKSPKEKETEIAKEESDVQAQAEQRLKEELSQMQSSDSKNKDKQIKEELVNKG